MTFARGSGPARRTAVNPMSLETETVLDRRRLRRQVTSWRVLAVLAALVAVGAMVAMGTDGLVEKRQIARVSIEGMIQENRPQLAMLKKIAESKNVAAVIIDVNSPGGTTTGGEALFESFRRIAEKKPVVARFGTVAASAGYIAGLGADYIVARGNTITGSVGVIVQWPEVSQLLDKVGVKMNEVKSGPLKATPSPFQPLDDKSRKLTESMVAESQIWFVSLVAGRRGLNPAEVPGLLDGRIFSGREAVKLKLVDEIGGEAEAIKWLEEKRNVPKGLKVVDWKPRRDYDFAGGLAMSEIAGTVAGGALSGVLERLKSDGIVGAFSLDGLVSVWHPSKN